MLCLKGKISRKISVTLIFQEDVIVNIKMYKILYIKGVMDRIEELSIELCYRLYVRRLQCTQET
jgi:hypothetical protein